MNIAKFLRTAFFIEHLRWLVLNPKIQSPGKLPVKCEVVGLNTRVRFLSSLSITFFIIKLTDRNNCEANEERSTQNCE